MKDWLKFFIYWTIHVPINEIKSFTYAQSFIFVLIISALFYIYFLNSLIKTFINIW